MIAWIKSQMFTHNCIDERDLGRLAVTIDPKQLTKWLDEAQTGKCGLSGGICEFDGTDIHE